MTGQHLALEPGHIGAPRSGGSRNPGTQFGPVQREGCGRPHQPAPAQPAGTDAYLEMRGGRADTSMPSRRRGATCWSTRNRIDAASRPETMASTRTSGVTEPPDTVTRRRDGARRARGARRSSPDRSRRRHRYARPVQLGILFWFYRDVGLCRNRLRLLRRRNPGTPIYGLYGGPRSDGSDSAPRSDRSSTTTGASRRRRRTVEVAQRRHDAGPMVRRARRGPPVGLVLPRPMGPGRGVAPRGPAADARRR